MARLIWERFAPSCDMDEANSMRGEYSQIADAILTAIASGSGDHAEQVEDAMEALQIIDAFPSNQGEGEGRITEKGDRMLSSCTRDVRRALETLLAENAALRAEHVHLVEEVSRSQARLHAATEAERKLAEAVGLLGTLSLMFHPDSAHGRHVRTFLECSR